MHNKYFIKTYGCQMNENDSEYMAGILESAGYAEAKNDAEADILLVNTCSVRDAAERKANGFIYDISRVKEANPDAIIAVCGCMAERMGPDLLKKFRSVDMVIGPDMEKELLCLIGYAQEKQKPVRTGHSDGFKDTMISKRKPSVSAFVTIMEGCDNFCSYCIVPYVRGREKSRTVKDIISEIEALDKNICKEVILLGQNVNSYEFGLAHLLKEAAKTDGIKRVRFMTSHPKDMSEDIIRAVAETPAVCEYFHVPFQSGNDEILKRMNRGYTRQYYIDLVKRIREIVPDATVTSDAIAGFPGETDSQFADTLSLIRECGIDAVNTLAFNPRPGTAADKMDGRLGEDVISARLQELIRTVNEVSEQRNLRLVGTEQELLVENEGFARTRGNKIVRFSDRSLKKGDLAFKKIKSAKSWVLQA